MSHAAPAMGRNTGPGPKARKESTSNGLGGGGGGGREEEEGDIRKVVTRVNRACDACRKQKMKCMGAENPPCRRCHMSGIPCKFEKPARESHSALGEAGLERIGRLENQVNNIQHSLAELIGVLKASPSFNPALHQRQQQQHNPVIAAAPAFPAFPPSSAHEAAAILMAGSPGAHALSFGSARGDDFSKRSSMALDQNHRHPPGVPQQAPTPQQQPQLRPAINPSLAPSQSHLPSLNTMLSPPFPTAPFPTTSTPAPSPGINPSAPSPPFPYSPSRHPYFPLPTHRHRFLYSAVTSAASSDDEDELPSSALVAPIEVLRGLADAAAERAAAEANGAAGGARWRRARAGTPVPVPAAKNEKSQEEGRQGGDGKDGAQEEGEEGERPNKRRKHEGSKKEKEKKDEQPKHAFADVVSKGILSDAEARKLFNIFFSGCHKFLACFDPKHDTYEQLRERSPFCVDAICMVAARVQDGGDPPSELYQNCLNEAREIARATLFYPAVRKEAVQAMILLAGWQDNGWLIGGHAVRSALEMGFDKALLKLVRRQNKTPPADPEDERDLVERARIWLCLYVHERQLSFGTGRTALLREDRGIANARVLLSHALATPTDARLVSTSELIRIRSRLHEQLEPYDIPPDEHTFAALRQAHSEFEAWFASWNEYLKVKHPDQPFFTQSLFVQRQYAELFHNATALRGIKSSADVSPEQREVALRAMANADHCITACLEDGPYRSALKYAVHYTHVCAAFASSFLLRLAKLFPEEMDIEKTMSRVEALAKLLAQIPASRYARSLKLMLTHARRRASPKPTTSNKPSLHPTTTTTSAFPMPATTNTATSPTVTTTPLSVAAAAAAVAASAPPVLDFPTFPPAPGLPPFFSPSNSADPEQQWGVARELLASFGLDVTGSAGTELPLWLQDNSLGDLALPSEGTEAFFLPSELDPAGQGMGGVPQLW